MAIPAKTEKRLTKAANIYIIAWCLLPLAAALGYAFYTGKLISYEKSGVMLFFSELSPEKQKAMNAIYWHQMARDAYFTMFDILGFFTIVGALLIATYWIATLRGSIVVRLKEKPWIILLTAVLTASVISCIASDNPSLCWSGNDYRHDGLYSYIVYGSVLICSSFTQMENRKAYIKLIAFDGFMLAVMMLCQYFEVPHFNDITDYPAAVFFNFNHLAYFFTVTIALLACLFVFADRIFKKVMYALMLFTVAYALIINNTFGCWLASGVFLVVCMLYASLYKKRFQLTSLLPLVIFICVFIGVNQLSKDTAAIENLSANFSTLSEDVETIVNDTSNAEMAGNGRFGLWAEALKLIAERPVTGYGPDSLDPETYFAYGYGRPHNEFIQYALFIGIPGALCYIAALILIFIKQIGHISRLPDWTVIAAGGVTAYLISSLFGNTTFYITPYFFLLLGMAMDTKELQD